MILVPSHARDADHHRMSAPGGTMAFSLDGFDGLLFGQPGSAEECEAALFADAMSETATDTTTCPNTPDLAMHEVLDIGHNPQLELHASGGGGGVGGGGGSADNTKISPHLLAKHGPGRGGFTAISTTTPAVTAGSGLLSSTGVKRSRERDHSGRSGKDGKHKNKAAALAAATEVAASASSLVAPSSSIVVRAAERRPLYGGAVHPLARPFSASAAVGLVGHVENFFIAAYLRDLNNFIPMTSERAVMQGMLEAVTQQPPGASPSPTSSSALVPLSSAAAPDAAARRAAKLAVFWGVVALGSRILGAPRLDIERYRGMLSAALRDCFDAGDAMVVQAYLLAGSLETMLGNCAKARRYMSFARALHASMVTRGRDPSVTAGGYTPPVSPGGFDMDDCGSGGGGGGGVNISPTPVGYPLAFFRSGGGGVASSSASGSSSTASLSSGGSSSRGSGSSSSGDGGDDYALPMTSDTCTKREEESYEAVMSVFGSCDKEEGAGCSLAATSSGDGDSGGGGGGDGAAAAASTGSKPMDALRMTLGMPDIARKVLDPESTCPTVLSNLHHLENACDGVGTIINTSAVLNDCIAVVAPQMIWHGITIGMQGRITEGLAEVKRGVELALTRPGLITFPLWYHCMHCAAVCLAHHGDRAAYARLKSVYDVHAYPGMVLPALGENLDDFDAGDVCCEGRMCCAYARWLEKRQPRGADGVVRPMHGRKDCGTSFAAAAAAAGGFGSGDGVGGGAAEVEAEAAAAMAVVAAVVAAAVEGVGAPLANSFELLDVDFTDLGPGTTVAEAMVAMAAEAAEAAAAVEAAQFEPLPLEFELGDGFGGAEDETEEDAAATEALLSLIGMQEQELDAMML